MESCRNTEFSPGIRERFTETRSVNKTFATNVMSQSGFVIKLNPVSRHFLIKKMAF